MMCHFLIRMNHRHSLQSVLFFSILLTCQGSLHAATSYLLIQGPFGSGGATVTDEWAVKYTAGATGAPISGQDLLYYVFGTPSSNGNYTNQYGTYPALTAGNATQGATYGNFGTTNSPSLFVTSFTLGGKQVKETFNVNPSWNYYVAGGPDSSPYNSYPSGNYPAGTWSYSDDGLLTRALVDGSYDGWLYGSPGTYDSNYNQLTPPDTIVGNSPTVLNFSGPKTLVSNSNGVSVYSIQSAPEPGRAILLVFGLSTMLLRRRRPSKK